MATWGATAQRILDAMKSTDIRVQRALIGGPTVGRKCHQFLVYADFPLSTAQTAQVFGGLPMVACGRVQPVQFRAVYTKDCAPPPSDHGDQPDANETTRWFTEFLDNCGRVVEAILAEFDGDEGITVNPGQFTGVMAGAASMSYAIIVAPSLLV